jgi:murein DD-endopeptidase MepM/ murein hydrolase activator NlpD
VPPDPGGRTRTLHVHAPRVRAALGLGFLAFVAFIGWSVLDANQVSATADQLAEVQQLVVTLSDSLHAAQARADSVAQVAQAAATKPARSLAQRLATRERAHGEAGLAMPAPGVVLPVIGEITSRFSRSRLHPLLNIFRPHEGVDLSAPRGTSITAPAAGRVAFVGRKFGDGLTVELDHGGGVITRYAHCQKALVSAGDHVDAGAVIATVGSSGLATGPHVHFEVVVNGRPVDPLKYLVASHDSTVPAPGDHAGGQEQQEQDPRR